ncbi:MAG: GreA/GreB family elongation factor [Nanoarchaeota archaeon]
MKKARNLTKNHSSTVSIRTKISIEVNGEPQKWEIVNTGESDIPRGKIAYDVSLIQYILDRKKGDIIQGKIIDDDIEIIIKNIQRLK